MAEITKETIATSGQPVSSQVVTKKNEASGQDTVGYLVYFFFGLLEILLAFRLVFKFTGASSLSSFVRIIYSITGGLILPFEGIFRKGVGPGLETTSVLEPSTIVAMIVYGLLAMGIVKLIRISSGEKQSE